MKKLLLLFISTQINTLAYSAPQVYDLPATGSNQQLKKANISNTGQPLQYAIGTNLNDIFIKNDHTESGEWTQLRDGTWQWQLIVRSRNAKSLGFGLHDFYLPPTAQLSFFDNHNNLAKGPYDQRKNKKHKQLWTGPIIGSQARIQLIVSDKYKKYVSFSINNVNRGFRNIWNDIDLLPRSSHIPFWNESMETRSLGCNIDVACEQGDDWQQQINSVGRYTVTREDGSFLCTGQMINNTANDGRALFLTADHCGFNNQNDASINIWWNYQANQCRIPGSISSGNVIPIANFNDTQSGSTLLASYENSDFALLELDEIPDTAYNIYYTGWDRRNRVPSSSISIHHPSGHAKRISIENSPALITENGSTFSGDRDHLFINAWDQGATEEGSSGAGLWNEDGLLVGQLHSGTVGCGNDDWYGRLYTSWQGGGSTASRLQDWLDPINSNVQRLSGLVNCEAISVDIQQTNDDMTIGEKQYFEAEVSGGTGPYTYDWDINNDQFTDGTEPNIEATYHQSFIDNIQVKVTDSKGCTGVASKAVIIESPSIQITETQQPVQVCGNNDAHLDPGERWRIPVTVTNEGEIQAHQAVAVFIKANDDASQSDTDSKSQQNSRISSRSYNKELHLETPAITLPDLMASEQYDTNVEFSIATNASCDTTVNIELQAAVYDHGFNHINAPIISTSLGNNGVCRPVNHCSPDSGNNINVSNGLWFNPERNGNGHDMHFSNNGLLYIQYTSQPDHSPIWYITGTSNMQNDQVYSSVNKIFYDGPFLSSDQVVEVVGHSVTTLLNKDRLIQTRYINGKFSADVLEPFIFAGAATEQRTGIWYNPNQAGWGASVSTQGDTEVVINYLYDDFGQPYWLIGTGANEAVNNISMNYTRSFCPHCPTTLVESNTAGSVRIDYDDSNISATLQRMRIILNNAVHRSRWVRNNLPLFLLTEPLE